LQAAECAEEIEIWEEKYPVNAKVHTIGGLSAHADQSGLLNWYGNFNNHPQLALVHGEANTMAILAEQLNKQYTIHAKTPKYGDCIELP